jgi:AcrR family transcriptional regulator
VTPRAARPGPRGRATRAGLLRAGEECFEDTGFAATTVAGIAAKAGVSQAAFYVYFDSKEELLAELVRGILAEIQAAVRPDDAVRGYIEWAESRPHHLRLLHLVGEVGGELERELYAALGEPYAADLRRSMAAGEIPSVDPELLAYALIGIGHFLSMRWVLWGEGGFPERLEGDLDEVLTGTLGLAGAGR